MTIVLQKDVKSLVLPKLATVVTAATAGGAGDNTAITGATIDRFEKAGIPLNAQIVVLWTATLAATKTLTLKTVKVQDSADGSNWADFATYTDPGVVATGPTGGATLSGATEIPGVDLSSARRYVRLLFTPDLSATATDTALVVGMFNLAGYDRLPQ
jgi:hypothetical protein